MGNHLAPPNHHSQDTKHTISVQTGQKPTKTTPRQPQTSLVLTAIFLVYLGQMILNPIIAPLSREVGLAEWQVGATISTAALTVVITSQFWGRRSQALGRKTVLVTSFAIATITMLLFIIVVFLGSAGIITGTALFLFFLLLRGVGFGGAIAAVPTTAQAYIADVTNNEKDRVQGMANVGTAQSIAIISGAVLGGSLSSFGLAVPLLTVPVFLSAGLATVAIRLRPESRQELIPDPPRVSPLDTRIWPFLIAGFGIFTALGFIQIITGFLVQDRLNLNAALTGVITGGAMLAAGIGLIVAQAIIVPKTNWAPPTLLRVGGIIALLGFLLLIPDLGPVPLITANIIIGLGIGITMPGYTAGPTLLVNRDEQGGLAGLLNATNGLTFVVAPTAGTALYGVHQSAPIIVGAVIMFTVTVFVLTHRRFKSKALLPVSHSRCF